MSFLKLQALAKEFEQKLQKVDSDIVIEEHEGVEPVSYMAYSNLKNIINDATELLSIMNAQDDLPQWDDEQLAIAKNNINKVLGYVRSEKIASDLQHKKDLVKVATGKYDHIDFKPPQSVADEASRGLELRKKNKGKGGLSPQQANKEGVGSGVARAVSIKNRNNLNPSTIRRMKAFFSRHEKSKSIDKGKSPSEDKGYIAWLLWGGDPGRSWAEKICKQMDSADENRITSASTMDTLSQANNFVVKYASVFERDLTAPVEGAFNSEVYRCKLKADKFIHFTTLNRAKEILESGKILQNPPYIGFGAQGVFAISTIFGKFVPNTQLTHIKSSGDNPVVAILFKTDTMPDIGFVEEVVWRTSDVNIKNAKIISLDEASSMIKKSPYKINSDYRTCVKYV